MKKIISLFALFLCALPGFPQEVEMADSLRADGKIYVVVAIVVVILGGLLVYVLALDRKATRLERKLDDFNKK